MAGQVIEFASGESHAHTFISPPDSTSHKMSTESYFDEVRGPRQQGSAVKTAERAERQLLNARSRLNTLAKFTRETELSASIIHQIKQPLTTILANAEAAKRWLMAEPPDLKEVIASIDRIVRDARAADETTTRIRAIFKQEPLDKKEVSVIAILSDAVHSALENAGKHKVQIKWHCDENLPAVYVDPLAIQELLINLISNAIDVLEDRTSSLIVVRAHATDLGEIRIQVIDNGPGIDDTEKIFDAFVTTKNAGLGIGLTVSRSIAETHGGRLWAEKNPSGGAIFCLALPLNLGGRNS